ncbi:MAG: NTP transferase domain-containing protein [Bifidobacteriaceae bacterium]|jgi:bifunctional UDP-N-acetylglucosamine pyrophosphorylase/glucosamine-1-phosphate N-acetyltransferase|nr:NTP transferase domain-containing protein [Bifidobacteriaceae bacterium]
MTHSTIILAAGKGTRTKTKTPKVLLEICGYTLIQRVINTALELNPDEIVIVLKHEADEIREHIEKTFSKNPNIKKIKFAIQSDIPGTAEAVKNGLSELQPDAENILVLSGDVPLISKETIQNLFDINYSPVKLLTTNYDNPFGYGRVLRENNVADKPVPVKIVEQKDATPDQLKIKEINTGIYVFNKDFLKENLENIDTNNSQGELYLTDLIELAYQNNSPAEILNLESNKSYEVEGVNDLVQLANLSKIRQIQINEMHMRCGVLITDQTRTYIEEDVQIGADTKILPDCYIMKNNKIGSNSMIGPMSYIRPNNIIGDNAKIGAYVEVKSIELGDGSKVPHLSYVGDATIGENTNIGAASIFANYDGVNKHHTTVGSNVRIGSDTVIIAPSVIEDNVYSGAGTVIKGEVPKNSLVISENRMKIKENWTKENR